MESRMMRTALLPLRRTRTSCRESMTMRSDGYDSIVGGIDNDGDNKVSYVNKSDCRINSACTA